MGKHHGPFQPAASKAKLQHPFSEVHGRQKRNGGVAVPIDPRIHTEDSIVLVCVCPRYARAGRCERPVLTLGDSGVCGLHNMVTQDSLRQSTDLACWPRRCGLNSIQYRRCFPSGVFETRTRSGAPKPAASRQDEYVQVTHGHQRRTLGTTLTFVLGCKVPQILMLLEDPAASPCERVSCRQGPQSRVHLNNHKLAKTQLSIVPLGALKVP